MNKKHRSIRLNSLQLEDRLVPAGPDLSGIEWRTIDGTLNNAALPDQGAAETMQIRFGYGDRFPDDNGDLIITTPQRANPRTISNVLMDQDASVVNDRKLTDWAFQWGQWITHDLDLTRTGAEYNVQSNGTVGDYDIPIEDPTDPLGPNPIPFNRSQYAEGTGVNGIRRDVVNSITSYIDASMVYGSDAVRQAELRTFQNGKMKTSAGGLLLPLNTAGLPNADPFGAGAELFLGGDVRANEQVNLTVVHTLFVREHNRIAVRINNLYPSMNDEEIYQTARRLVGAEMQAITYKEYLPAVFGHDFAPDPDEAVYDPAVDASITNSFAHAAFRFGHSQINEATLLVNNSETQTGSLSVAQAFFNPDFLKDDPGNVGRMLRGLATQLGQENDVFLVNGIRNSLFGPPGAGGLDLGALDIQRGRDHGLPDYNNLRGNYGLTPVTTFDEISSDPDIRTKLEQLYGNVDNIDAFVGAMAEDHLPGTSAGPLLHGLVGNQFTRLRDGDRFFYTNDEFLNQEAVRRILDVHNVTLAQVIKRNSGNSNIQDNVFFDKSVLIFEAPESGGNFSVVTTSNTVKVVNAVNGNVLAQRSLGSVSQLILVGSNSSADVFNLFTASPNNGLEDGIVVYGGGSADDRLNIFGRSESDSFNVLGQTVTASMTSAADPDIVVSESTEARTVGVNGNLISATGFETLRLVTLGGSDAIVDPNGFATVVGAWNPQNTD